MACHLEVLSSRRFVLTGALDRSPINTTDSSCAPENNVPEGERYEKLF